MKGNQMVDCPACAGPAALGGECATCNGITEVTQEVYDAFLADKALREELYELQRAITDVVYSAQTTQELKQAIVQIVAIQ